ncbi:MAG: CrcB protein [Alphaproteobacteria bacterium]|jgi:CrcB protein
MSLLAVAAGGAVGALGRYGVMNLVGLTNFPYATIIVNILGSLALGALLEANALYLNISETTRLFLVVGALGAFTTFSTFSMESMYLIGKGELLKAALYITATVTLSIFAFFVGMWLLK